MLHRQNKYCIPSHLTLLNQRSFLYLQDYRTCFVRVDSGRLLYSQFRFGY